MCRAAAVAPPTRYVLAMPPDLSITLDALGARLPDVFAVYVFGSAVQGGTHAASDLDLAVVMPHPLDAVERFDVQEAVAAAIGRDVDLVDLGSASTVMQMQVVSTGRVVLERDAGARAAFETVVYASYALLNEERAGILADVAARGRVYG